MRLCLLLLCGGARAGRGSGPQRSAEEAAAEASQLCSLLDPSTVRSSVSASAEAQVSMTVCNTQSLSAGWKVFYKVSLKAKSPG